MTAFRLESWTAACAAVLACGLAACGSEDVVKDEPTPIPPGATAPVRPQPSTTTPGAARPADEPGAVEDPAAPGGDSGPD